MEYYSRNYEIKSSGVTISAIRKPYQIKILALEICFRVIGEYFCLKIKLQMVNVNL